MRSQHHSPASISSGRVALPPGPARPAMTVVPAPREALSGVPQVMPPRPQRCPPSPRMLQRSVGGSVVSSSPPSPAVTNRAPPSPPLQHRMAGTPCFPLQVPGSPWPQQRNLPPGMLMCASGASLTTCANGAPATSLGFSAQAVDSQRAVSPPCRTQTPGSSRDASWPGRPTQILHQEQRNLTPTPNSTSSCQIAAAGTPGFGQSDSLFSSASSAQASPPFSTSIGMSGSAVIPNGNGGAATSSQATGSNFASQRAASEPELFDAALSALRGDQGTGQFHTLVATMLQATQSIQQLPELLQKLDARLSARDSRAQQVQGKTRGRGQTESSLSPPRRLSSTSSTNTAVIVEESPMGTPPSAQRSGTMSAGASPIPCAREREASPPSFALAEVPSTGRGSNAGKTMGSPGLISPPPSCRRATRTRLAEDVSEAVELSGDDQEVRDEETPHKGDATFSSCMTIQPHENDDHMELMKALAEREAANAELRRELTEKSAEVESKDQEIAEIRTTVHRLEAFIESQNAELVTELRRHAGKIAGLERAGTGAAPDTALVGLLGGHHSRMQPRGGGERMEQRPGSGRRGGRAVNGGSMSPRPNHVNGNAPHLKQRPETNGMGRGTGSSPHGRVGEMQHGTGQLRISAHRSGPFVLPKR